MSHKHLSLSSFELAEDGSHLRMTQPSYLVIPDQRACWILNPEVIETYPSAASFRVRASHIPE
jgi:hypothetical protein